MSYSYLLQDFNEVIMCLVIPDLIESSSLPDENLSKKNEPFQMKLSQADNSFHPQSKVANIRIYVRIDAYILMLSVI